MLKAHVGGGKNVSRLVTLPQLRKMKYSMLGWSTEALRWITLYSSYFPFDVGGYLLKVLNERFVSTVFSPNSVESSKMQG